MLNGTPMDLWWTPDADSNGDPWWRPPMETPNGDPRKSPPTDPWHTIRTPNGEPQKRPQKENPQPTPEVPPGPPKDPQQTLNKLSTDPHQPTPNRDPTDTYCNENQLPVHSCPQNSTVKSRYHRWFQWGREKTSQISESGQPVWYCIWFSNIEATHWSTNYRNSVYQSRHRSGFSTYEIAWLT